MRAMISRLARTEACAGAISVSWLTGCPSAMIEIQEVSEARITSVRGRASAADTFEEAAFEEAAFADGALDIGGVPAFCGAIVRVAASLAAVFEPGEEVDGTGEARCVVSGAFAAGSSGLDDASSRGVDVALLFEREGEGCVAVVAMGVAACAVCAAGVGDEAAGALAACAPDYACLPDCRNHSAVARTTTTAAAARSIHGTPPRFST